MNALRNSPQIQQLRAAIASNPDNAQALIQQLAAQNPQVAQTIAANPQVLMELLGVQFDGQEGDVPPGAQVVNVTAEERAAIERVSGFVFVYHARCLRNSVGGTWVPSTSGGGGLLCV